MVRDVGDSVMQLTRELPDRLGAFSQVLDDLEAPGVAEDLKEAGSVVGGGAWGHWSAIDLDHTARDTLVGQTFMSATHA